MARIPAPLLLLGLMLAPASWGQNYPYVITTIAGINPLGDGGPATSALLESPNGVAVDSAGNVYISDARINHRIRQVTPDGTISTLASGLPDSLIDLKIDASGNLYAADTNYRVYRITRSGAVSVIAGAAQGFRGDNDLAVQAALNSPYAAAADANGNVYVADTGNNRVRMITPDGMIRTIAGNGTWESTGDGSPALSAHLMSPETLAVDGSGNLYIGEAERIRKVTPAPSGIISTIAGPGGSVVDDILATKAFAGFAFMAPDAAGNLYISNNVSERVRLISASGTIRTVAGTGTGGFSGDGGPATAARLNFPQSIALDGSGNLYIADTVNNRIRKVTSGIINTLAGRDHFAGDGGAAAGALIHLPAHAITDRAGNLYISDSGNSRIRKVTPAGVISTIAGPGDCAITFAAAVLSQSTSASLCSPVALALDGGGNLYVADSSNHVVRRIDSNGVMTVVAGNFKSADAGDDGPATSASLQQPSGLAMDGAGNLYVSDSMADRVRKISLSTGTITAVAGTGRAGFSGDGGLATAAQLSGPSHLAVDGAGNLYISDSGNLRVRKVSGGTITTVAGVSTGAPSGLALDAAGNLYIALQDYCLIDKLTPSGDLSTIAGTSCAASLGDGGLATNASLFRPAGLWADSSGDLYLADCNNNRIRKLILDSPSALAILGGDAQSGSVGAALPNRLTVQVSFRAELPVSGVPISFGVTSGSATPSATTATTDSTGVAGVSVTLGATPGPVIVTATLSGVASVQFHLTATAGVPAPVNYSGGVAGAGGSVPPVMQISPGGFATAYGSNFAPAGTARQVQAADLVNGNLPTRLAGVCVQVGDALGFVTFVSPGLVNFQVPNAPLNTNVNVQVVTNCGAANELRSAAQLVATQAASPEFLYWVGNASGKNPVVAVNALTGAYIGAPGLIPGLTFTPARPGDYLTIYGISFGPTNPAVTPGAPPGAVAATTSTPVVTLGSSTLARSNVLYAGVSPGTAGLYQLNIQVPADLADGDYALTLTLGTFSTPPGGYVSVKR